MGCCASTQRDAPGDAAQNNSSSRAIVQGPQSVHRPSTQASNNDQARHRARPAQSSRIEAKDRPNEPLRFHIWESEYPWTRAALDEERTVFFDTQTSGRPEIWQTIRSALEVLWDGGDDMDDDGGIATAQQILNAADITLPTGDVANGCYDSFGGHYAIPAHIVANPQNLVREGTLARVTEESKSDGSSEDEEALKRREAKGKAVLKPNDTHILKARRSDGVSGDLTLNVSMSDSIKKTTRRLKLQAGLQPSQRIRISYLGRMLDEKKTLEEEGWIDNYLVNAYISG